MQERFLNQTGIEVPLICGAMYPCSNPELVAAVSEAGGLGIVQPLSMTLVHKHEYRQGLQLIRRLTKKPIGVNIIVEQSVKAYRKKAESWLAIALEEGVRFFVTALGNPRWVVDRVHAAGGVVYHDVTERKWALKARDHGVDGLICVNARAGGHAGGLDPQTLYADLLDLDLPLICAGGVGDANTFVEMLRLGYAGVQMGTRFICTDECRAHADYKQAIIAAKAKDIVLTEKLTGVPVAIIETPYVKKMGTQAGPIAQFLLKGRKTKHWMRTFYSIQSIWKLGRASLKGAAYQEYFQAGKSVEGITAKMPAGAIVEEFKAALAESQAEAC